MVRKRFGSSSLLNSSKRKTRPDEGLVFRFRKGADLNSLSVAVSENIRWMDYINKEGLEVVAADYECVYSGILLKSDDLETLYSMFNDLPPADFKAHSMSVSDVVVTNRDHELRAYYVDSFGFTELPAFALERKSELNADPPLRAEKFYSLYIQIRVVHSFPPCNHFYPSLGLVLW